MGGLLLETDVLVGLGASVDQMCAQVADLAATIARSTMRPRLLRLAGTAIADASGNAIIQVGDPCPQGYEWEVLQIVVGGLTWATVAAGTAVAFSTSAPPLSPDAPLALFNVDDEAPSLPNLSFYLEGQFVLSPAEVLCLLINGGTSGQTYAAKARVLARPLT